MTTETDTKVWPELLPVECPSSEMESIIRTWLTKDGVIHIKESQVTTVGILAASHVEQLVEHIEWLNLQIKLLRRQIARS